MPEAISWQTKMDEALAKAEQQSRPVLLDFFNPG